VHDWIEAIILQQLANYLDSTSASASHNKNALAGTRSIADRSCSTGAHDERKRRRKARSAGARERSLCCGGVSSHSSALLWLRSERSELAEGRGQRDERQNEHHKQLRSSIHCHLHFWLSLKLSISFSGAEHTPHPTL
jgi:hypothetical protein